MNAKTRMSFHQGDFLFREGDPIDGVLKILKGRVEITRERDAAAIVLGTVDAGQFLGEMGALEHRLAHSAAARAATDVDAEIIPVAVFLDEVIRAPETARDLIVRLSQRLHDAEDRIVSDEQPRGPPVSRDRGLGARELASGVTLTAATSELRGQLAHVLEIETTPYLIGRAPLPHESPGTLKVDLQLRDREPLRLSRDHFAIVQRQGRLFVRDLHSHLGTAVNGQPIGEHFGTDEAPLRPGPNEIIAGGIASPFVFTVHVPAGADVPRRR